VDIIEIFEKNRVGTLAITYKLIYESEPFKQRDLPYHFKMPLFVARKWEKKRVIAGWKAEINEFIDDLKKYNQEDEGLSTKLDHLFMSALEGSIFTFFIGTIEKKMGKKEFDILDNLHYDGYNCNTLSNNYIVNEIIDCEKMTFKSAKGLYSCGYDHFLETYGNALPAKYGKTRDEHVSV